MHHKRNHTYILFFIFLLVNISSLFSQSLADTISIEYEITGHKYYYHNQPIKANDISLMIEKDFELYDLFETSREAFFFGKVFTVIGAGLLVVPFTQLGLNQKTQWGYALAGTGFIGISVPIFRSYHKKSQEAIRMYNMKLYQKSSPKTSLRLGTSNSGLGLSLNF